MSALRIAPHGALYPMGSEFAAAGHLWTADSPVSGKLTSFQHWTSPACCYFVEYYNGGFYVRPRSSLQMLTHMGAIGTFEQAAQIAADRHAIAVEQSREIVRRYGESVS